MFLTINNKINNLKLKKAGSEKYKSITTAHYRKSVGALLFYDLTGRIN